MAYASNFKVLAYQINLLQGAWGDQFYKGLKDMIKDGLQYSMVPHSNYAALKVQATAIDHQVQARVSKVKQINQNNASTFMPYGGFGRASNQAGYQITRITHAGWGSNYQARPLQQWTGSNQFNNIPQQFNNNRTRIRTQIRFCNMAKLKWVRVNIIIT